jgi:hypothetical protein
MSGVAGAVKACFSCTKELAQDPEMQQLAGEVMKELAPLAQAAAMSWIDNKKTEASFGEHTVKVNDKDVQFILRVGQNWDLQAIADAANKKDFKGIAYSAKTADSIAFTKDEFIKHILSRSKEDRRIKRAVEAAEVVKGIVEGIIKESKVTLSVKRSNDPKTGEARYKGVDFTFDPDMSKVTNFIRNPEGGIRISELLRFSVSDKDLELVKRHFTKFASKTDEFFTVSQMKRLMSGQSENKDVQNIMLAINILKEVVELAISAKKGIPAGDGKAEA